MNWDIGCSRNIFLSHRKKSKVFHVRLHYELKRYSDIVLESQNFPKLENLDIESQISEFKWVIHNGLRRTSLIYRSDRQQVTISQHRWNGYQWIFLTNIALKKEEYQNLLEHLPTLLSYIEKFKKTCIDMDEGTQSGWILSFLSTYSIVTGASFQCFPKMKNAKTVF